MRVLLVVNPSASSVNARIRVLIESKLSAEHDVSVVTTNRQGHAARLARGAASTGTAVVAVLGGDGTLNEAANGLAGTDTALAPLPGGSTNVFARTIGLPNDAVTATDALVRSLRDPAANIRRVGLGRADDRYFLFHLGIGFDAALVELVEQHAPLKRWAGHPLFAWAGVSAWFRHYDHRRPRFAVRYPDQRSVEDAVFAIVANTNPYTFVGNRPFDIAPAATLDRPLATVTVRDLRFWRILELAGAALASAERLAKVRGVTICADVTECEIVGHGLFPVQMDGETLGKMDRVAVRHVPDVLALVTPVGTTSPRPNGRLPDRS
ncbi:MAG TPA: diacylglycerol kinase family protein [Acidimicrobiales bacterium]|nr:diacylglycerol kinase family protein [Acidimicrobiales bacterium]